MASDKAPPTIKALIILLLASGCFAILSTALPVAFPVPNPPPITASAAIPAPNADIPAIKAAESIYNSSSKINIFYIYSNLLLIIFI